MNIISEEENKVFVKLIFMRRLKDLLYLNMTFCGFEIKVFLNALAMPAGCVTILLDFQIHAG